MLLFGGSGAEPRIARRDGARERPRRPDAGSRFALGCVEFDSAGFEVRGRVYALGLVAIAELDGLVDAGGGAGGGHGAEHALVGVDVRLDGGVTAGVENLASDNLGDGRGGLLLEVLSLRRVEGREAGTVRDAIFLRHAAEGTKREAIRARNRDRTTRRALATPETRRASVRRTLRQTRDCPAASEREIEPPERGSMPLLRAPIHPGSFNRRFPKRWLLSPGRTMKETGSAALALTAALMTSSTFLPRPCSSMYS